MTQKNDISHSLVGIDVVILCGGKGTRLSSVISDRPKVMAEVGSRPFLSLLLEELRNAGASRIILSVGHMAHQIKSNYNGLGIFFAEEKEPLGTGGAIKNAESLVESDHFVVMNGDSWIKGGVDWNAFMDFHKDKRSLVTLSLVSPRTQEDYGAVFLNKEAKIEGFNEKEHQEKEHFMSAGIYCMDKAVFSRMSTGSFSIEHDFFPKLVGQSFYGFPIKGELVDIGTPERYIKANEVFGPTYFS